MARVKSESTGRNVVISAKARANVPSVLTDAYALELANATEGMDEDKVINDIEVTSFATIRTITVESVSVLPDGKTVRVNGEFDIDLEKDEENDIFKRLFTDKSEAIEKWRLFMEEKVRAAEEKRNAYNKLVDFLANQIKEENF